MVNGEWRIVLIAVEPVPNREIPVQFGVRIAAKPPFWWWGRIKLAESATWRKYFTSRGLSNDLAISIRELISHTCQKKSPRYANNRHFKGESAALARDSRVPARRDRQESGKRRRSRSRNGPTIGRWGKRSFVEPVGDSQKTTTERRERARSPQSRTQNSSLNGPRWRVPLCHNQSKSSRAAHLTGGGGSERHNENQCEKEF